MDRLARVLAAHIDIPEELAGSLGVLVISVVILLIVYAVRGGSGGKQTRGTVAMPGGPTCSCGMIAKWTVPNGPWHCDRCNLPVQMAAPGVQPPTVQPPAMPLPVAVIHSYGAPAPVAPQGPVCPTCRGPGRWIPESHAWGCDRCRMLIQLPVA
ncbi:MAG: hypothetical protein JWP01_515 [Myxococcales bacterium]|nr:hypothetical protein [Myxococcales bacterium]